MFDVRYLIQRLNSSTIQGRKITDILTDLAVTPPTIFVQKRLKCVANPDPVSKIL